MSSPTIRSLSLVAMLVPACIANAQFTQVDTDWTVVDIGGGTKPSFDFDADGGLHVMGMTEARPGIVWYAKASDINEPWTPQTVASGYFYGPGDLLVDASTTHIAWHDHDNEDAAHISITDDLRLTTRAVTPGAHDGWDNSLAIASDGQLRMASNFPSGFGATNSLTVSSLNNGDWTSDVLVGSGPAMYGLSTSIAIDSEDRSHVAYSLATDWTGPGSVSYAAQNSAGGWNIDPIESGMNVGRFPSIAVDGTDQVHAAWINIDPTDETRADVRYATLADDWQVETVATLEDVQVGFLFARKLVSLEVDAEGKPHLAYGDRRTVSYATKQDDVWQETTVVESTTNPLNGLVVLRLNADEQPGIAFWRPDSGPLAGVVSLAVLNTQELFGDFDFDGALTATDVDLLTAAIDGSELQFDVNNDNLVNIADRETWVTEIAMTLHGDANLDRSVNFDDFLPLATHFGQPGGWAEGDFDGSGDVRFLDFVLLATNFGSSTQSAAASVPEPSALLLLLLALPFLRRRGTS